MARDDLARDPGFSLITRMLALAGGDDVADHLAVDAQAVGETGSSPVITVPSPIRVRIGGCFCFPNMGFSNPGPMQRATATHIGTEATHGNARCGHR